MTLKERAAMQQALEALENNLPFNYVANGLGEKFPCFSNDPLRESKTRQAITALREALSGDNVSPIEQAEQSQLADASLEPVAWYSVKGGFNTCGEGKPLYAAPVQQAEQEPVEGVLPCPFCGCIDVSVNEGNTFRWRYAMCDNCGAQAGEVRFDTLAEHTKAAEEQAHKDAIEEWNRRAAPVRIKDPCNPLQDLTDDEIETSYSNGKSICGCHKHGLRAAIAADREKNK